MAAAVTCVIVAIIMGVIVAKVVSEPQEVTVFEMPHVKGMTEAELTRALQSLRDEGFKLV